jgi:hypothetical protein
MPAVIEARIIEMRHDHPGWGPRTIGDQLGREGFDPVPAKTSIYRALVGHGLISPVARRRKRADYRRWERARAMELWQMDITGGVRLDNGTRPSIVTGIDDHSRFWVCALVVARATAKPTCDALSLAMRRHGSSSCGSFTRRARRGVSINDGEPPQGSCPPLRPERVVERRFRAAPLGQPHRA